MKLTSRGEYALRALLVLGLNAGKGAIRIQTISEQQNIPKRFLEQILNDLKAAGIVASKRGVEGGYQLMMPPEEITLAHVIRHVEGALAPVSCVSERYYEKCTCPNEATCAIRTAMKEVRDAIVAILEKTTLAELCQRSQKLTGAAELPVEYCI